MASEEDSQGLVQVEVGGSSSKGTQSRFHPRRLQLMQEMGLQPPTPVGRVPMDSE